mmetsp:Transcript_19442/g.23257  ORF Transcript_19442/g.23257 Transcript_19442/m.23257 type:complete len:115 (+) Transcript_19442:229-573(+)
MESLPDPSSAVGLPHLEDLRWRVEVTLSSSTVSRVLRPTVLMRMKLSDGRIHLVELPVDKFHELRHAVARSLHEMETVAPKVEAAAIASKKVATNWTKVEAVGTLAGRLNAKGK